MTSSGPNSPEGIERQPSSNTQKSSLLELFEDVTESKVFDELHNEAELLAKIKNSPDEIIQEIRYEMKERLIRSPGQFTGFSEQDIFDDGKLSNRTILDKMRILLLGVVKAQQKIKTKILGLFEKDTFADTPAGRQNGKDLDVWISRKNEKEIEKYLKSPALLRAHLRRQCFGEKMDSFIRTNSIYFIERLGINENNLDEEDKESLARLNVGAGLLIGRTAEGRRILPPDTTDINRLLQIIHKAPCGAERKDQVKKEIIREFLPMVTPKFLVELGLLTQDEAREKVKKGLEESFGDDYFTVGTTEELRDKKHFLESAYKKGWYIEIPTEEYLENNDFVKNLFDASMRSNTPLTEVMHEELKDMALEVAASKYDMGDMKIQPDTQGNWHPSFIDNIAKLKVDGKPKVQNFQNLKKGSYIRVVQTVNEEKKYGYFRIVDTDVELSMVSELRDNNNKPVKHRGMRMEDWTVGEGMATPGNQKEPKDQSYVATYDLFSGSADEIEIITEEEMRSRRSPDYVGSGKIITEYTEHDTFGSVEKLSQALGWTPKLNHIYTTKKQPGGDFFMEIMEINERDGTIKLSDGIGDFEISFSRFYEIAKQLSIGESGPYQSEEDITKLFGTIEGFSDFFIKDGKIQKTIKDEHGHDKNVVIDNFVNEDGEAVSISSISNGKAEVKYGKIKDWDDNKGKVNLGKFPGDASTQSIVRILGQLRDNEYKPYENPKDQITKDAEAHMPHTHGSLWGKLMNGTSFSDMTKAFDLYKHAWEHKLEKNSKFQSAKFADRYLRKLMPEGFSYQLRSEAYAAQNEAMEGILKMLENDMNGKEARLYVREKILLNDDAKFEEVLAGLLYVSKKAGQLYPEELSDLKNSELWFYKLAVTQGYTTKSSRADLRKKCIAKTDKAASGEDAVSEMDIIERQLKLYEGAGKRIPPNIAPKFPGAIAEGMQSCKEKGEKEVNTRTNIQQMNKYALSKLNVGEAYKVIGCIDRLHTKNGTPMQLNQIPFTLLMSNMPEYMGTEFRKMLHGEGNGDRASHAFKFGNELTHVNTYRRVVMLAAKELDRRKGTGGMIAQALQKIEDKRKHIGDEYHGKGGTEDDQKNWINSIYAFWEAYGAEMQPLLQMSDTFISAKATTGDRDCMKYKSRFVEQSGMQNGNIAEKIYENANVGEGNMTSDHTPFHFTNMVSASFRGINYQNGMMNRKESVYGKIFTPGVLGALEKLRNMTESEVIPGMTLEQTQRQRFTEYYAAIVYYMRRYATNPPDIMLGGVLRNEKLKRMNYMLEFDKFGLKFEKSDFRSSSQTTPEGVEITKEGGHSNLHLDAEDKDRCEQMFQSFRTSASSIVSNTKGKVGSKINFSDFGG